MPKRVLIAMIFIALAAQLVLAQQPKMQRAVPPAKPKPTTAVTVIDLRGLAGEKKPPKREADSAYSMRMMSGTGAKAPTAALAPAQLGAALQEAGISVVPSNLYARLAPGQSSAHGKGYICLLRPEAVYPDRAQFPLAWEHAAPGTYNGPLVVLREPGTYSLDFLVEFTDSPVGGFHNCLVLIGHNDVQMKVVSKTEGPQHIVIVWTMDQERAALPDEARSVGIHCYIHTGSNPTWTFYLVDVTKL